MYIGYEGRDWTKYLRGLSIQWEESPMTDKPKLNRDELNIIAANTFTAAELIKVGDLHDGSTATTFTELVAAWREVADRAWGTPANDQTMSSTFRSCADDLERLLQSNSTICRHCGAKGNKV